MTKKSFSVEKFGDWLVSNGGVLLATTSPWEVIRVKTNSGVLIAYRDKFGRQTWKGELSRLRAAFLEGQPIKSISPNLKPRKNQRYQIAAISKRDGQKCWFCGKPLPNVDKITIEHLVAKAFGGPDHISNLVLACDACNQEVGTLSVSEKVAIRERLQSQHSIAGKAVAA
ncbi:HNH endonuclease [Bartonella apis]|uniref:HNH endonuclease n=1 Tax=Bartonella apis TaxID=1686310 RepID=UPI000964E6F9|nr:HNH endonuclease [Bartonella apis]OLY45074.1 HNH endonuclease [Bartonella apis]